LKNSRWDRRVTAFLPVLCVAACLLACTGEDEAAGPITKIDIDNRPLGQLEDIVGLASRDDVNVVFILIDTLRADRLSAYGYERNTTPVLDYLARTGLRFDNHRAQSTWTKTSMASMWTSLYPQRVDVLTHRDVVSPEAEMPAEVFAEEGFATAAIWRNGWVAPNFGFNQGFDVYLSPRARQAPSAMRLKPIAGRIDGTDIDAIYSATEFLRAHRDDRFFLYMHLMDLDQYVSVEELAVFGTTYSDAYDNALLWEDKQIGEILAELFRLDIAKETMVVVASDHGEAFGEHGAEGHAKDVHEETTRTPWIIAFPFRMDPGTVVEAPTQNVDLWPTIFDLLAIDAGRPTDGVSRVPLLLKQRMPAGFVDRDFAHLDRRWGKGGELPPDHVVGVRQGRHRLIHVVNEPDLDLLYDVESDRAEQSDIASAYPDVLNKLQSIAADYLQLTSPWEGGAPEIELDQMHLRQLRALGYSIED